MEFRLRKYSLIPLVLLLLATACNNNAVTRNESTVDGRSDPSVNGTSCATEFTEKDNVPLNDGSHIVRMYADPACYRDEDSGLVAQIGIVLGGDTNRRYYADKEISSLSVGEIFEVDDDIKIEIESTEVEENKFIYSRFYGSDEPFIRVSKHHILVHPQDHGDGIYEQIKDYWLLGKLNDYGEYDYIGRLNEKLTVRIDEDCRIIWCEKDWLPLNDEDIAQGNPYKKTIPVNDLPQFMAEQKNKGIIFYQAGVTVKSGKIVEIEMDFSGAEYVGG